MAVEDESERTTESEPLPYGKGMRVRITEGDAEGAVGEIVWWGKSRWGRAMRAGVQTEGEESEKIWVDATGLRAIDDDGKDLDPQPVIKRPAPVEVETRSVEFPYDLARTMTAVRLERGYPESKAPSATVRLDRMKQAEEKLDCAIPDPIIAYVASGLGSIRKLDGIIGLTADLCQAVVDDAAVEDASVLAFDCDDGDYLAFNRGDERDTDSALLFQQEEDYDTVTVALIDRLSDELDHKIQPGTQPFEVIVDYITTDESEPKPPEQWVTHAKFGRGIVLASETTTKGEKLTIRFDGGDTRILLDRFVDYD